MRTPLILDVNPDREGLFWEQDFLGRIDARFSGCCGPDAQGGCPLLRGTRCAKAETADGIIFQLDLDRAHHRAILAHYIELVDVPIRVVVTAEQQKRWADLLAPVEVFTPPIGPAALDAFAAEVESDYQT